MKLEEINEYFRANAVGFQETFLFEKQTFALLAFDTVEAAKLALESLNLTEISKFGGKLLILCYSKLTPPKSALTETVPPIFILIVPRVTSSCRS